MSSFSLVLDIFPDRCLVQPYCCHVISFRLKVSVPKLVFQVRVLIKYHQCALPLQISHKVRHRYLGRYADQHMYMARHQMPFQYLYSLVPAQLSQYLSYAFPILIVDDFSPILRCKDYVILAQLFCVRQTVFFVRH